VVKGSVFLRADFHAVGQVGLPDAQIGHNLDCAGGTFTNPKPESSGEAVALLSERVKVAGDVFLREGFNAKQGADFSGAQIGGDLDCSKGKFYDVDLDAASVTGTFYWRQIVCRDNASLNLTSASVGSLVDDEKSWPKKPHKLILEGFVYQRISFDPPKAQARLDNWLALQERFIAQPYLQLAKVLREAGHEDDAVLVLKEMERRRRDVSVPSRIWSLALSKSVGYGYNPEWSAWGIAAFTALGWVIYRRSYLAGKMVPTEKDAHDAVTKGHLPGNYVPFSPLVYSVENSLPLVKLGQSDRWQPGDGVSPFSSGAPASVKVWRKGTDWLRRFLTWLGLKTGAHGNANTGQAARWGTSPRFVRAFLWIQILLGWLLATLFLAAVTGIVHK
jgi:hypothetical protein